MYIFPCFDEFPALHLSPKCILSAFESKNAPSEERFCRVSRATGGLNGLQTSILAVYRAIHYLKHRLVLKTDTICAFYIHVNQKSRVQNTLPD